MSFSLNDPHNRPFLYALVLGKSCAVIPQKKHEALICRWGKGSLLWPGVEQITNIYGATINAAMRKRKKDRKKEKEKKKKGGGVVVENNRCIGLCCLVYSGVAAQFGRSHRQPFEQGLRKTVI